VGLGESPRFFSVMASGATGLRLCGSSPTNSL
jgi:hypothetical protein